MSRLRSVNERAVEKTIAFLESLKIRYDNELKFNSTELQEKHEISKSTFSICKKLNFVKAGKWIVSDPNRNQALQILEILRQQASKRIDVALGEDFTTAIDRLTASMNTLSIQNENAAKRPGMLSKALNQAPMQSTTLFDAQLNNDAKLFELVKAIAPGMYNAAYNQIGVTASISTTNECIIEAAKDLLNKLNN